MNIEAHELGKFREDPLQMILKSRQGQTLCEISVLVQLHGLKSSEVGERVKRMLFTAAAGALPWG